MLNLKKFDQFSLDESVASDVKRKSSTANKTKFRFEVSDSLKKVSRMQKSLLDLMQLSTEISDEIVALRAEHPSINPDSMKILNNMKYNLDNINKLLRKEDSRGSKTGIIDNSNRFRRNLERLKRTSQSK